MCARAAEQVQVFHEDDWSALNKKKNTNLIQFADKLYAWTVLRKY